MRRDDFDQNEYALMEPGIYGGHIWDFKKHDSNPNAKGEVFPMFLIEVRVDKTKGGSDLIRPRRLFLDAWPSRAATIHAGFVADDATLANFEMPDEEKEKWKNAESILGKPCFVELDHETYETRSGEPATKHLLKRIYPDFHGEILDEAGMDGIDSIERYSTEKPDEEMPVAQEKPF